MYDFIRGEILRTTPLPGPEGAFAIVRREEQRRRTMLSNGGASSVVIAVKNTTISTLSQQSSSTTTTVVGGSCTHCGNPKYGVESCFKKHGYPEWWQSYRLKAGKKGNVALCTPGVVGASSTIADITSLATSIEGYAGISHYLVDLLQMPGNIGLALLAANSEKDHGWILDSGATNHMTYHASLLRDNCLLGCSYVANATLHQNAQTGTVDKI